MHHGFERSWWNSWGIHAWYVLEKMLISLFFFVLASYLYVISLEEESNWSSVEVDLFGWMVLLLFYASMSYFLVSLAFLFKKNFGVGIFMKSKGTGRISVISRILLGPYYLQLSLQWWFLYKIMKQADPAFIEFMPGVYTGRVSKYLPKDTSLAVDLTAEFNEPRETRVRLGKDRYRCLPILKAWVPRISDYHCYIDLVIEVALHLLKREAFFKNIRLAKGEAQIVTTLPVCEIACPEQQPGKVYVHCSSGHGRSGTFVCAVVMALKPGSSLGTAIALFKERCPLVKLNDAQLEFLEWLQPIVAHRMSSELVKLKDFSAIQRPSFCSSGSMVGRESPLTFKLP